MKEFAARKAAVAIVDLKPPEEDYAHSRASGKLVEYFQADVIPTAEECGVRLAAHPADPPLRFVPQQPRLVYQPYLYQPLLDPVPSKNNALEFCVGTMAEMAEGNVYEAVDHYSLPP